MTVVEAYTKDLGTAAALADFGAELERTLAGLLQPADEARLDPRWAEAGTLMRAYGLRPAKRVRPMLVALGWGLASGAMGGGVPAPVRQVAAGLELLHLFMLVHDDVADRAGTRRGGPALQRLLGEGKAGDDLAVVLGDHLYARGVEAMLASGHPLAVEATRRMMAVCRHTAAGQYLDLQLSRAPLSAVTVFQALKVAQLKTAHYGFEAPLALGALLGGGSARLQAVLARAGRQLGLAFQLRDDLLGLFGDDERLGKDGGGDFVEGKRTFPVLAAFTRADAAGRQALAELWEAPERGPEALLAARGLVERWGGRAATERVAARLTRGAGRLLAGLPAAGGVRASLEALAAALDRRRR